MGSHCPGSHQLERALFIWRVLGGFIFLFRDFSMRQLLPDLPPLLAAVCLPRWGLLLPPLFVFMIFGHWVSFVLGWGHCHWLDPRGPFLGACRCLCCCSFTWFSPFFFFFFCCPIFLSFLILLLFPRRELRGIRELRGMMNE